jgi:hypothetical protein
MTKFRSSSSGTSRRVGCHSNVCGYVCATQPHAYEHIFCTQLYSRMMSSKPPAEKASELIESMPSSPGLVTKTGAVVLGSGLLATAISQELYVVNEETVIAAGFAILATFIARSMKEPYKNWANGHIKRVKDVLEASRSEHTQAVKDRIGSVEKMKDVVSITEGLFALSKVRLFARTCSFGIAAYVSLGLAI